MTVSTSIRSALVATCILAMHPAARADEPPRARFCLDSTPDCVVWPAAVTAQTADTEDGTTPWTTRTAGFLAGWQDRIEDTGAAAPIGGWIAVGSERLQLELEISRANRRSRVDHAYDPYTGLPVVWQRHRQDTAVNIAVVRTLRTDRTIRPRLLGGIGVVFETDEDQLLVVPPADSPLWRTSPPGTRHVRRWPLVAGIGIDVHLSRRLVGRFDYRLNLVGLDERLEGINELVAGVGVVF